MSKPQGVTPALDLAERLWEWIDGFSEDDHKLLCDDLRAASQALRDQSATIEALRSSLSQTQEALREAEKVIEAARYMQWTGSGDSKRLRDALAAHDAALAHPEEKARE